jgi:hypothetical protein
MQPWDLEPVSKGRSRISVAFQRQVQDNPWFYWTCVASFSTLTVGSLLVSITAKTLPGRIVFAMLFATYFLATLSLPRMRQSLKRNGNRGSRQP